ncbi:hypothetical protein KKH13_00795 [Patescibacteria group bacterium]|nr:hypothetical protein [Patescibacteria group bacterium]
MAKPRAKSSLPLIIVLAAIGGLAWQRLSPQPAAVQEITEPSPSPELISSAQSSDGEISLTLKQNPGADTSTWTLTAVQAKEAPKRLWWATLPDDTTVSIPFNAVSPDNKYLFLKQEGPDKSRYLVLTSSGAPLTKATQTVEFSQLFEQKYPDYQITEATGWGGINLIVFNTDKIAGGTGPSFWFDLSGQSFIRLSNRFD